MLRAFRLARRGRPTFPNPAVGCVLASGGRVVGEGCHRGAGTPHAEPQALADAGSAARGSTAYVTMEPCVSQPGKRTPPCADALARAGVARVVAATLDPSPWVRGAGVASLRRAGVRVSVGLLADQARALNRDYFERARAGRPRVILKTALSLDGRTACPGGRSQWITGPDSRRGAHWLRSRADAVLVGVGTVLADDPLLTSHGAGRDPLRVVLDSRLRTPRTARLLAGGRAIVFTRSRARLPRGLTIRVPAGDGGLDLRCVLAVLSQRGVRTLLVEGGPTVQASFLRAGLVDEASVFIAPKLISGSNDPNRAPRLQAPRLRRMGGDFWIRGKVTCSPA